MNKFMTGATAMMLIMLAGLLLWFSAQGQETVIPDAPPAPETDEPLMLPEAQPDEPLEGPEPPDPPKAYKASREELRFNRYDRDRDEVITRLEMMSSRTKSFRELDKDGNNLLSFEEWAAATATRFAGADADNNNQLTRAEFRTTRPKRAAKRRCRC
ncbi:hypothetical protein [Parasphingorhabdus sp.]|uniref:hypothetical protein n=1 Tax=Parasphingorhabdus sp. TaxID=2709688 RepID=UPI00326520F7